VSGVRRFAAIGASLLAAAAGVVWAEPAPGDPRFAKSQEIVARFHGELSGRLKEAMGSGGPVHAIDVCSRDAPAIAARLSAESGADVGRVAAAVRNPANAADTEERETLEKFRREIAAGAAETPVAFDVAADGSATFMKAIVTQPACLACHGAALAPEVASAVARQYPEDRATGFAAGDLRGAFVVRWPADRAERAP
jgi:hypothetical protein